MSQVHFPAFLNRQRGAALLIFLLIGALAATSLLLKHFSSRSAATGNQATMQALTQAKEALIGWSASHGTNPGMLPCPEDTAFIGTSSEGRAQTACSNSLPSVGRLPWRTLDIPQLLDDASEPLWYALSPGFRAPPINSSSLGQLMVDGTPNNAVAIIFSPGVPLSGQNRTVPTSAQPPDVAQYLDGINNDGTVSFTTIGAPGLFNDRLLTISHLGLFAAVNRRILSELRGDSATGVMTYYSANGNYPWAAADASGVPVVSQLIPFIPHTALTPLLASATNTTMTNNNWYPLISYTVEASRQQATLTIATPTPVSCKIIPGQDLCQ
jgi:hypothetical protein